MKTSKLTPSDIDGLQEKIDDPLLGYVKEKGAIILTTSNVFDSLMDLIEKGKYVFGWSKTQIAYK